MGIEPIGDIFRVKSLDRKSAIKTEGNKSRAGQDTYDKSDASGHREQSRKHAEDTVEISQAYQEIKKAYQKRE